MRNRTLIILSMVTYIRKTWVKRYEVERWWCVLLNSLFTLY